MPANQSTPEVTRTDREAAAALRRRASDGQECWLRAADNMEAGHADGSYFVQAFARHRLASATPARGGDELREALEQIAFLSTNHGGWFESEPWEAYKELGDIARKALASTDMAGAGEGFVLMPKTATRAMVDAADACTDAYSAYAAMVEAAHVH